MNKRGVLILFHEHKLFLIDVFKINDGKTAMAKGTGGKAEGRRSWL